MLGTGQVPELALDLYKVGGGAKRLRTLLGDHAEVSVFSIAEYGQFKASGLRALAVLAKTRHPAFPDLPRSYEVGITVESANTQFAWAPKGLRPNASNGYLIYFGRYRNLLSTRTEWRLCTSTISSGRGKN